MFRAPLPDTRPSALDPGRVGTAYRQLFRHVALRMDSTFQGTTYCFLSCGESAASSIRWRITEPFFDFLIDSDHLSPSLPPCVTGTHSKHRRPPWSTTQSFRRPSFPTPSQKEAVGHYTNRPTDVARFESKLEGFTFLLIEHPDIRRVVHEKNGHAEQSSDAARDQITLSSVMTPSARAVASPRQRFRLADSVEK